MASTTTNLGKEATLPPRLCGPRFAGYAKHVRPNPASRGRPPCTRKGIHPLGRMPLAATKRTYFFGSGFPWLVFLPMHPHPHPCGSGCSDVSGLLGAFGLSLIYAPPSG